ncbi:MAG: hypothetical protein AAGA17_18125 [Actinomycetota bacterium]
MSPSVAQRSGALATTTGGVVAVATAWLIDPGPLDPGEELAVTMLRSALGVAGAHAAVLGSLWLLSWAFGWRRALRWSARLGAARIGLATSIGVASLGVGSLAASTPVGAAEADVETVPSASLTPVELPVASLVPIDEHAEAGAPDESSAQVAATDAPTWNVEQGDHLWSIAEARVGGDDGIVDDAEVHDYWVRLVELNADRLVVPGEPDLILPGQELLLPE